MHCGKTLIPPLGGPEVSQHISNQKHPPKVHNTFPNWKHNSIIAKNTFECSQHICKLETQFDIKTHFNIHNTFPVMPSLKGLKPGDYRRLFTGDKSPGISPQGKVPGLALGYISPGISLQR